MRKLALLTFWLIFTGPGIRGTEIFQPGQILYSTVDVLRIREAPNLQAKQIGKLEKGDSLRVLQVAGEEIAVDKKKARWIEFDFEGKKGYAFGGFLAKEMPLLAHTPAQWAKIAKKNAADVAKREKELAQSTAESTINPLWGCQSLEVFGWPREYEAGCTERKIEAIQKIKQNKNFRNTHEAVDAYGDGYCKGWHHRKLMEFNCGGLGGDAMADFPLPD